MNYCKDFAKVQKILGKNFVEGKKVAIFATQM